ncbi:MAG: glycosyl hydrolase family 57 [Synechococcaceae cyanobacterium]|nr:glycosyl hydrolase family 57 [Synechococcaceae cyanobacterium]
MGLHSLPPIAGREAELAALRRDGGPVFLPRTNRQLAAIDSAFACALHMHQPTIPAGADGALISHLQFMLEHPHEGDNHNAEPFLRCYGRMAELIPQLIAEGADPRVMLDFSGTLLWGLEQMGRHHVLAGLRQLATDPDLQPHVEWLGSFWGHAVAPSTPLADLSLQILAWQHQFAALFGDAALARVRGFSLPEMHLPNHPDSLFALVHALREAGYRWLLVQEHSVENPDGSPLRPEQTCLPQRLVARNSHGASASITALIKTQGSDTKLVGQMQPCAAALGLGRQSLAGRSVPAIVTQIGDGENGGVMMNEFPAAFLEAHRRLAAGAGGGRRGTVAIHGSEYLELLEADGLGPEELAPIQAVRQHRLWERLDGPVSPEAVAAVFAALQAEDPGFTLDGASWTNHISWEEGYADVLDPMQELSTRFHRQLDPLLARDATLTRREPYQRALLHLLLSQTSCFRYWGQGSWTGYAREIQRRGLAALDAFTGA